MQSNPVLKKLDFDIHDRVALILAWYPLKGEYLQNVQTQVLAMHAGKRSN